VVVHVKLMSEKELGVGQTILHDVGGGRQLHVRLAVVEPGAGLRHDLLES